MAALGCSSQLWQLSNFKGLIERLRLNGEQLRNWQLNNTDITRVKVLKKLACAPHISQFLNYWVLDEYLIMVGGVLVFVAN